MVGTVKVIVDTDKCQGHARCHAICPELFELDSIDQKSRVKLPIVPAELEERTRRAVNECPEGALSIER
jgi:ferredoxin